MGAKLSTSVGDLLISFDNKGLCKNPVQTTLATQITRKDTLVVESSVYNIYHLQMGPTLFSTSNLLKSSDIFNLSSIIII